MAENEYLKKLFISQDIITITRTTRPDILTPTNLD